jgi:hypothetical protein
LYQIPLAGGRKLRGPARWMGRKLRAVLGVDSRYSRAAKTSCSTDVGVGKTPIHKIKDSINLGSCEWMHDGKVVRVDDVVWGVGRREALLIAEKGMT